MSNTYTEKAFQQEVRQIARLYGWADYYAWNSRHSPAGWPDLTLWRPPHLIFAELKTNAGRLTEPQQHTIGLLRACQRISACCWRPADREQIRNAIAADTETSSTALTRPQHSHKSFQAAVRRLATAHGWADYCLFDSRRSPAGWPDLILVRPPDIIAAELKVPPDRPSPAQSRTLEQLAECRYIHAFVWRPHDWQQIADTLFRPPALA